MQPLWTAVQRLLTKLKTQLPYDPAITLIGIYLEKTIIQNIHAPHFTAAVFTIAKMWKQPKCQPTEEWIKKVCHIHATEYYSAIKNVIMPFAATWMVLEIIIVRERQIQNITYMWRIKHDKNGLIRQLGSDSQTLKMELWLAKGKGSGKGRIGKGCIYIYITIYIYSTRPQYMYIYYYNKIDISQGAVPYILY